MRWWLTGWILVGCGEPAVVALRDAEVADRPALDAQSDGMEPDALLDAALPDATLPDAALLDAALPDAALPDVSFDAGPPDAGPPDAGPPDAGPPDAGPPDAEVVGEPTTCIQGGTFATTSVFDGHGRLTTRTIERSGELVFEYQFVYDELSQLVEERRSDANGPVSRTAYRWEAGRLMRSVTFLHREDGLDVSTLDNVWSDDGLLERRSVDYDGQDPPEIIDEYFYDDQRRLVREVRDGLVGQAIVVVNGVYLGGADGVPEQEVRTSYPGPGEVLISVDLGLDGLPESTERQLLDAQGRILESWWDSDADGQVDGHTRTRWQGRLLVSSEDLLPSPRSVFFRYRPDGIDQEIWEGPPEDPRIRSSQVMCAPGRPADLSIEDL
jgi:hypothetical protein